MKKDRESGRGRSWKDRHREMVEREMEKIAQE